MNTNYDLIHNESDCAAAEMACLLRSEGTVQQRPVKMSHELAEMLASGTAPVVNAASFRSNVVAQ